MSLACQLYIHVVALHFVILHNFPECNIHLLLHVVPEKGWNPANIHDCVIGLNLAKFCGMLRYMYIALEVINE